ncbi:CidA/LrgA family protein [Salinimonas marina]|uniref:CidA/LrgA family protein n=1 Tax=Salinimonas marina TaxID=2785918 RepID=A0A7S9HD14_9ALTE|nr:CidA/LrgA family protein [Salinimonas marina]QPG05071.1 CidA/LrgA family protein [Salinimonas marina]
MRTLFFSALGLLMLVLCYLAGEVIVLTFNLPFPGALAGLLVLLLLLLLKKQVPQPLHLGAKPLLTHMTMLFVPAVTSVVLFVEDIQHHWLGLSLAIVASTLVALVLSAWISQWIFALKKGPHHDV